ncbi:MAG: aminotransferase class III-fold pyridoxal phosphate-dependent enzyme [Proteobacteria bacterium]|nr:aminotransferase class III-fold pyridoxal phosphate-dependent enzyme [Pseudomonadota bacterium]
MTIMTKLKEMREFSGNIQTVGLSDPKIEELSLKFPQLVTAVNSAHREWQECKNTYKDWFKKSEFELISFLQEDFVNFYKEDAVNPYVAFYAVGPWVITTHGAVVHDSGGYGMLGLGQGPENVIKAMSKNVVMANIMTASFSQKRFTEKLQQEIGQKRNGNLRSPFSKFLCMNSGSEAMTVACRISDVNAKLMTDPGGRHAGKQIRFLAQKGSFHGRTERPAKVSDSSKKGYQVLASYRGDTQLDTIEPGNLKQLEEAFKHADQKGIFYEALFVEPVMGEGNPGMAMTREFYDLARKLTKEHGSVLIMDSIQSGIRATGYLSVCDYPGFENCEPPEMESYSKAINAGQYPLSVLGLTTHAANLYKKGIYGNTMTSNPRALEVACSVLDSLTPELRANIRVRGQEFLEKFNRLKTEFPDAIVAVQGTGLLFAVELNENGYTVLSKNCVELDLRLAGIGVIHGGKNALRFTPHFGITSDEIDLIVDGVRNSLKKGPIFK